MPSEPGTTDQELQRTLDRLATKDDVFLWLFLLPGLTIFVMVVAFLVWGALK